SAVAVFHPVPRFAHVPIATIDHQIGFSVDRAAELDEFVRSKVIRFDGSPGEVRPGGAIFDRTDTIHPAIARYEVAPGIAYNRQVQSLQGFQNIPAKTLFVGQWRTGLVDAAIHAASQMFDEAAKNMRVDTAGLTI